MFFLNPKSDYGIIKAVQMTINREKLQFVAVHSALKDTYKRESINIAEKFLQKVKYYESNVVFMYRGPQERRLTF